ncbi:glycosyltransferase [Enterovibrio norvegicus FF-162]|uniref:glycosyltransferase family 4 protein n=1 Tax=Enterovibrio norvegicus TaxID=188144 RepID=UPI000311FA21|nr:glycosyltransferase family 4 protein [Enterovibrio norvegicus]OEE86162.1 glycosyltransferase [Enterovibrio norvegicus FF-162]
MNKKIVLSSNTSWYIYNFRSSTISALTKKGVAVHCVSPRDDYTSRLINELGVKWHEVDIDNKGSNPFRDIKFFIDMVVIYYRLRPDVVLNFTIKNNIYGTLAAKLFGPMIVNNVSGLGTVFIKKSITTKIVKLLYKLSQPFADVVFCQNSDDLYLLTQQRLVSPFKIKLLPGSGVNVTRFNPGDCNIRDRGVIKFIFVGRMLRDKGVVELIKAAHYLDSQGYKFTLKLCGGVDPKNLSGFSKEEIESWCSIPMIEWLGSCENMPEIYGEADCVVLPSYREGLPRTLLEAGAMGLPSVTTDVPGCRHVIEDGFNGFLCKEKDHISLANSMRRVLELSNEEYMFLSKNARERVIERFDENIVVDKTLEVLGL